MRDIDRECAMTRFLRVSSFGAVGICGLLLVVPSGSLMWTGFAAGGGTTTGQTSAYASAGTGQFTLSAGVLLGSNDVRFLAGWSNPAASCRATRRVVVDATLAYTPPSSATRVFRLHRAGDLANCVESGPNFGPSFSATRNHLSCNDGRWLPGQYTFSTTAIVAAPNGATPDTTLRAVADLTTGEAPPCP
ncbi:MAG TPA: hypothetical protein VFN61_16420 [Acidimicrobiales bacterium]|nr:hypothetical protein [Acidimicrobiales bacterium]